MSVVVHHVEFAISSWSQHIKEIDAIGKNTKNNTGSLGCCQAWHSYHNDERLPKLNRP